MTDEDFLNSDTIRTFRGRFIDVFAPNGADILLDDIAHSLSMQPRFGGHLPIFYSVAHHCIVCCEKAEPEHKLAALFHDASEAYLVDIPTPIKKRLSNYKEIEDGLMRVIAKEFGFEYPLHEKVKAIDKEILLLEWNVLMIKKAPECYRAFTPKEAEQEFKRLALTV